MFPFRRRKRVLMLDDDSAMRRLVALLLQRAGYRVDCFVSGNDAEASHAIRALGKKDYAAILLDLMMPLEGGMTVIRHLREQAPTKLRRVVLVTGAPDGVIGPLRKEIFGVVRKPFQHDAIVKMVADATA